LREIQVLPQETDPAIAASAEPHYAYVDNSKHLQGLLVVFLGGTNSSPNQYLMFPKAAAAQGYHVVNINYPNTVSGRSCGDSDPSCFAAYHEEFIFGSPTAQDGAVNAANSIQNRLVRLLQYLDHKDPGDGWDQFFSNNTPVYTKLVVAGHSQGGGHAAYIGHKFHVNRVLMFSSPYDYNEKTSKSATWCTESAATPAAQFFGVLHRRDEIVPPPYQYEVWKSLRMLSRSDTVSADRPGFEGAQALYTDVDPNPNASVRLKHNAVIMDEAIPSGAAGDEIKKVWAYFLQ
jgi:hypothetical protein